MSEFTEQNLQPNKFTSDSWVVLNPIERSIKSKIERIGKPLKDWDIQINYGIKTGFNEAFIIDGKTKNELIKKSPKSAEVIRPILRGRDIKRYKADFADLWLLNVHNGSPTTPPVNIEDYPEIKAHLDQFYPALEKRQDKGITPYNLRSCIYTDDFSKQKIIYPEITKFLNFYYDEKSYYVNNKCFILTGGHLCFLTAFFNSKLFRACFKDNFPELLGGTRELRKVFIEEIPVLEIDDSIEMMASGLIKKLSSDSEQDADSQVIMQELDNLIYELYCLTEEEISFIDSQ